MKLKYNVVFILQIPILGIGGDIDFVKNVKTVISQWSEVHVIVSRYIFFFLQDLTKFR